MGRRYSTRPSNLEAQELEDARMKKGAEEGNVELAKTHSVL
jgi:hypothetical protein